MRFGQLLLISMLAAACSAGLPGACNLDTDCAPGAKCDPSRNLCVIPNGACFPACPGGQICISAKCQTSECSPVCNASEICDLNTATCKPVTTPTVALTSPAANSFTGIQLQATADARAPGGVNGVDFQVRPADGTTVLAHTQGAATTPGGANYAATVVLNSGTIPDGPVDLVAVMSYPTGSLNSAALRLKVDLTPPVFSGGSVTPAWLGPQALNATVTVSIADSGSGVDPASVQLTLTEVSHAPYPGIAGTGNNYVFTVPMVDLGVAAGNQGTVHFKIDASDVSKNAAASLTGQAFEAIKVDRVLPSVTLTADPVWHAATQTVSVQGTASDAQSGLTGGAAGVKLTGGSFNQPGTITGGNYTISADLSTQSIGATEAAFPITVSLTDSAGNTAQASGSLNVDNKPPQVSAIGITPAADCLTVTCGHDFYKAGAGNVTVSATVVDSGAGVDGATVFLKPAATGANTTFTPVAGVAGASNSWTFTLPRSVGNGLDGSAPVQFVIAADDTLAAGLSGASKTPHQGASAPVSIFFDDKPPVITPAVDATWYKRKTLGGDVIIVHANIVDAGAGLAGATLTVLDANNGNAPQTGTGTCNATTHDCTFNLDSSYLGINSEAALSYSLTAQDKLSTGPADTQHAKTVADSRNVDGKPPTVTITRIFNAGQATAAATQVSYPDAVANTGYDVTGHFIYSDTVTVTGTIQDSGSGIAVVASPATPNYEVDGTSAGPKFAITSCTDGATTMCNFTATVKLNDPGQAGGFAQSDSTMQIVVNSADKAVDFGGAADANVGSSPGVTFNVTRFWWKQALGASSAVSGLAVYPSAGAAGVGDVIATTPAGAGADSVFSLFRTGPFHSGGAMAWSKGAGFYTTPAADLGSVQGAPAIGAAATAPTVYVATAAGDVVAFNSTGGTTWNCGKTNVIDPAHQTPAIVQASKVGGLTSCEAVVAGADNKRLHAICGTAPNSCVHSSATMAANGSSPVTALAGNFYAAAGKTVAQTSLDGTGGFNAVNSFSRLADTGSFSNILTDGSELFAINNSGQKAYAFDATLIAERYAKTLTNAVNGAPLLLQSGAPTPGLLFNESDANVYVLGLTTTTPPETLVAGLTNASSTTTAPVLGSDNRIYTDGGNVIFALNQKSPPFTTQWSFDAGAAFNGPLTMDCQGILYAASGGTVYAFVTDAKGLGNSPWPKYQRDARNSGNADAATLWGANVSGTCTQ